MTNTVSDPNQYACNGFHPDLKNGKASGSMTLSDSFIQFTVGDKNERFPLDDAELKLGGASDRLVFFSHPSISKWRLYTSDRSVLNNAYIQNHPALGPAAQKAKGRKVKSRIIAASAVIAIILIPVFLLSKMDLFSGVAAKQIPLSWEQKLGESTLAQYKLSTDMMDQQITDETLSPLTNPLIDALQDNKYTFQFYISHNTTPNAFALPGGYVVIHSGLILSAESAEELLGVLAHEISHVTLQHGLKNVIGTAGIYVVISAFLGDASGLLATIASAAPFLLSQTYSRTFERQADEAGYQLLLKAKVSPTGLASFFEKLLEEEQKRYAEIEDENTREVIKEALGFLSTHPASEERIAYLRAMNNTVSSPLQLQQSFIALQNSVREFTEQHNKSEE